MLRAALPEHLSLRWPQHREGQRGAAGSVRRRHAALLASCSPLPQGPRAPHPIVPCRPRAVRQSTAFVSAWLGPRGSTGTIAACLSVSSPHVVTWISHHGVIRWGMALLKT